MDVFRRQDSRFLESSGPRNIKIFKNGDHSKYVEIALKQSTTFPQLREESLHKLGLKDTGTFRLYTSEGIELYEDYIPLIRDEDRLYVSQGEEFDQNTSLAGFKEISVLGQGGFGKVLLMEETDTGEKYAVKHVDARKYGLASLIDMVFKEAELLKSLNHKHIVQIMNFFALKDMRVIFVMEYLEGGELGQHLKKKGRLEEQEALEIFKQLVDAVYFCHMNNIIHRDLKLENILFESKNSNIIKVVDFGIAGFYSGMKDSKSNAGSLRYMAPEVLSKRNNAANPAIDIWSMGVILYALLHGNLPFSGNRSEIPDKIINGEYEISSEVKKKLSPECLDLLTKMLCVDEKSRINTFEVSNHPWITGEKILILPTWEDEEEPLEESPPNKARSRPSTKKNSSILLGQLSRTPKAKLTMPKSGFEAFIEKEPIMKIGQLDFQGKGHRKSNSRDQACLKDFLVQRETKPSNFREGKTLVHKRLQAIDDSKFKDVNNSTKVSTSKKTIFPPISGGLWGVVKPQAKTPKKITNIGFK